MSDKKIKKKKKSWFKRLFSKTPTVPVLRFTGPIGMATPLNPGISLANTADMIERAFEDKKAKAVAVIINSPGGSPVQSMLIYKRLRALAEENDKKIYVFTEDVAASGGYFIACAGDEIYADPSSIIGSIGVIAAGFGFDKAIEKLGVERRVYTAGEKKLTLDSFQPENADDVARLKELQKDIHKTFKSVVTTSRGEKLSEEDLFTGEFWTGNKALELGLIDGLSDVRTKMRELFGPEVELDLIKPKKGLFGRNSPQGVMAHLTGATPAQLTNQMISSLEERALWSRFGL
ncbi:MAG: S49 family peptidase [Rhizobiales bacterium]|nr:S49 family peptidase [Hyphomicrobiales bacterium]